MSTAHELHTAIDVRTSSMGLQVKWSHPRIWGAIATAFLVLFACISSTVYFMDLTRSGFIYQLLFILSTASLVPALVCTAGGALFSRRARAKALGGVNE